MKTPARVVVTGTVVLAAVAVGGLLWNAPWLLGIGKASAEDLRTVSHRLAAKLPLMIDAETRLEKAEPGAGLEQVFRFTLVRKDAKDLDVPTESARLRGRARGGICGDTTLAPLVARGVKVTYVYQDRSGNEAIRFSVEPMDCLLARLHLSRT